jgi:ubiquitin carboxyl-terminal hydrolase 5/13
MERAVDWLFSHAGDDIEEDIDASNPQIEVVNSDAKGQYSLLGFISHRGPSAHCGHYVAYVKKNGNWVLFNDNKVVSVPDISAHLGEAYIYVYTRNH